MKDMIAFLAEKMYTVIASHSKAGFLFITGARASLAQSNIAHVSRPISKSASREKQHDPLIGRGAFKR
jgi:hypothetical protein